MKICENCGVSLGDAHPFTVCPRCLLGDALKSSSQPDSDEVPSDGGPQRFRQLHSRVDFFQKYELLEKVGGGGQGDVWKVWDFEFRREVAMKRLAGDSSSPEQAAYRFLAEAQITSQLDHPGILPVFDVGLDPDGKLFYTTQLLPGTTIRDVWRQVQTQRDSGKSVNRALELLLRVCEIVAHAHDRGVIHRDLKPDNILVGAFGEVRIIDWGSAKVLEDQQPEFEEPFVRLNDPSIQTDRSETLETEPGSHHATVNSGLPLTPAFAAPELLQGNLEQLKPQADIYSLGVMLYELLAGRLPYSDNTGKLPDPPRLTELILAGPPPKLRSFKPLVSRDLAAICEQAMAHDWRDRTRSAVELAENIRAVLEVRPVKARHPGPWLIFQKWALRNQSYVLLGSLSLVLISAVLSIAHGFKAERDSARQIQDLREAELASRNGHWREAIGYWDEAASDGYADSIYLDIQKAQGWTVLNEPARAGALLTRLAARSDLGGQRAVVLLRLGEHELSGRTKSADGVRLIQEAMAAGLANADLLFAQGLMADSTPAALDLFHQALRFDPYHYGAHANSLGLEFLLGHHQELANHLTVFKILYPDDSSPHLISAIEAAMQEDPTGAQAELALLRNQVDSNSWEEANEICQTFAATARFYDVDALLREEPLRRTPLDKLRTDPFSAGALLMPGAFAGMTNPAGYLRMPWLPCIKQGEMAGNDGLRRLLQPYLGDPTVAVQEIEFGWRHHPEATIPVLAAMLLENQQPTNGPASTGIMEIQARLYQMGADSPALIPQMGRLARYLAARTEFELAARRGTNSWFATNCLANIRQSLASPETSPEECRAYFQFALGLGANATALELVSRLDELQPTDPATGRYGILADLALKAFGPALEKINQLLVDHPNDRWALAQRQSAQAGLNSLINSTQASLPSNP